MRGLGGVGVGGGGGDGGGRRTDADGYRTHEIADAVSTH